MLKKHDYPLDLMYKYGKRCFYKKNAVIYKENTSGNYFYLIHEGLIKIFTSTMKGNERILNVGYPGQIIGVQAFQNNHYVTTAMAMTNSILYRIPFHEMKRMLSEDPQFLHVITDILIHHNKVLIHNMHLDTLSAKQRLSFLILLYMDDFEQGIINMKIRDFTKYTGLTRVTVYNILKEWERENIIDIKGNHFFVKDAAYFHSLVNIHNKIN